MVVVYSPRRMSWGLADYCSPVGDFENIGTAVDEYSGMKALEKELLENLRQTEW